MPTFSKNRNTGQYDVLGEVGEIQIGPVTVNLKSGATRDVVVSRISSPFTAKFGELTGKQCVFGTVAEADSGSGSESGSGWVSAVRDEKGYVTDRGHYVGFCGYECNVTGRICNPKNGPCHDCQ